ncbi:MAG: malonate transporter subunit MadM [Clostridia bacterium]|nr:malonate transporter subunit MadM [Clostridia bacterium]
MSFLIVGIISVFSNFVSSKLTHGRIHNSAIAIFVGLILAYVGGTITGGEKGISDISVFAGLGILGGSSLRDFAIVATSFGAKMSEIKKCGAVGIVSLLVGILTAFIAGAVVAIAFGYTDAVSVSTIAAGTVTFVVGPVTGAALGAESTVIAISVASGLVKSIAAMLFTPVVAKKIGLNTPRAAMIFGGLMGTTSGTTAGLAATDASLVPYGAMTAPFYTGLGCLLCPSVLYPLMRLFLS